MNTCASVDSFAALLEQGLSAMKPVICSSNSLFVANDSWSQMVAMAANSGCAGHKIGQWNLSEKVTILSTQSGGLGLLSLPYNAFFCSTFLGGARIFVESTWFPHSSFVSYQILQVSVNSRVLLPKERTSAPKNL